MIVFPPSSPFIPAHRLSHRPHTQTCSPHALLFFVCFCRPPSLTCVSLHSFAIKSCYRACRAVVMALLVLLMQLVVFKTGAGNGGCDLVLLLRPLSSCSFKRLWAVTTLLNSSFRITCHQPLGCLWWSVPTIYSIPIRARIPHSLFISLSASHLLHTKNSCAHKFFHCTTNSAQLHTHTHTLTHTHGSDPCHQTSQPTATKDSGLFGLVRVGFAYMCMRECMYVLARLPERKIVCLFVAREGRI